MHLIQMDYVSAALTIFSFILILSIHLIQLDCASTALFIFSTAFIFVNTPNSLCTTCNIAYVLSNSSYKSVVVSKEGAQHCSINAENRIGNPYSHPWWSRLPKYPWERHESICSSPSYD